MYEHEACDLDLLLEKIKPVKQRLLVEQSKWKLSK